MINREYGSRCSTLLHIMILLAKENVHTTINFDHEKGKFFLDLETHAKSHLYLWEDGLLEGRYNYQKQMILTKEDDDMLNDLCYEFIHAQLGRDFGQLNWIMLCGILGIKDD